MLPGQQKTFLFLTNKRYQGKPQGKSKRILTECLKIKMLYYSSLYFVIVLHIVGISILLHITTTEGII